MYDQSNANVSVGTLYARVLLIRETKLLFSILRWISSAMFTVVVKYLNLFASSF